MSCGWCARSSASAITPRTSASTSSTWSTARISATSRSMTLNASCVAAPTPRPPRSPHQPEPSRVPVRRLVNLAGFALCAALIVYALYSQMYLGLEPCPLCIFQRIGIALLGVVFLAAALHHPRGRGARVYAALLALAALATAG